MGHQLTAKMIRLPQKLIAFRAFHALKINSPDLCRGNRMPARRTNGIQRSNNFL